MDKEIKDITEFNEKFSMMINDKPTLLTHRKIRERLEFILEEFIELVGGAGHHLVIENAADGSQKFTFLDVDEQDIYEQADALIDLVYVIKGTAIMMGLPWDRLWDDVQRANMAKVRGMTKRGHVVDCMKPHGWVPPMTKSIIDEAGYDINGDRKDDHDI